MISIPVKYPQELSKTVSDFKALPDEDKNGTFWDKTDDDSLKKIKKHIKDHYLKTQEYKCCYCQQEIKVEHNGAWDTDHVIPKSTHPQFMFEERNLCVACKDCNIIKSSANVLSNPKRKSFPEESAAYIIYHPHFDAYSDHITILGEFDFFLPRTDKGRKTVEVCGLLRFIYKYAGFDNVPDSYKTQLGMLYDRLMRTNDPQEEHFILDNIAYLTGLAKQSAREKALKSWGKEAS